MTRAALAAIGAVLGGVAFAGTAHAVESVPRNGACDVGEFCLYFNSDRQGSVSDFAESIPNYGVAQPSCYEFRGPGAGQWECVKNNAASAWNRAPGPVTVFFNSGYAGASQVIAPGAAVNLSATLKNENASHRFEAGGGQPVTGGGQPVTGGGQPVTGGGQPVTGGGAPADTFVPSSGALRPGQELRPGQSVSSPLRQFRLTMGRDGSLRLYGASGEEFWRARRMRAVSGTTVQGVVARMQDDGNFVVYRGDGRAIWSTRTDGRRGAHLAVQDDGNLVVYAPHAVWSSHTRVESSHLAWAKWDNMDNGRYLPPGREVLRIYPNALARVSMPTRIAFQEALERAGKPHYPHDETAYRSLYMQFRCHFIGKLSSVWDLESWRPVANMTYLLRWGVKCNPR